MGCSSYFSCGRHYFFFPVVFILALVAVMHELDDLRNRTSSHAMDTLDVIKGLWPELSDDMIYQAHYKHFLGYIESYLNQNFDPNAAVTLESLYSMELIFEKFQGVEDICEMLLHIKTLPPTDQMPRNNIIASFRCEHPASRQGRDDESMIKCIAVCYSFCLTLHIIPDTTNKSSYTTPLRWDSNQSISAVISSAFPTQGSTAENGAIDQKLTLEYLSSSYGFKVVFIDNLKDHLTIQPTADQPWLLVYQHKIFLKNELRFGSLLPRPLVEEAMDTLNLLMPYDDEKTATFLRRRSLKDFHSLGPCGRSRKTDLADYKYFGHRISQLCAVIKGEPPLGIQQLLPGRHGSNLREFLNFWIAAFVGGLTIFSIAFGITALVYAKWAYDVALLQYQLSLAQACAEPGAAEQLPSFC